MSATAAPAPGAPAPGEPRHGVRIAIMWAVLTVIAVPLVIWVAGRTSRPTTTASSPRPARRSTLSLLDLAVPVIALIWVYFGYSIAVFRQRGDEIVDGPPLSANPRIQITWLGGDHGAGAGPGGLRHRRPVRQLARGRWRPGAEPARQAAGADQRAPGPGHRPAVAVDVPLPRATAESRRRRSMDPGQTAWSSFHVTSLDVDHSFWAYELGVKADAIPGSDNVAYVKPPRPASSRSAAPSCAACGTAT